MVGIDGRLVYETIIRPDDTIVDYNTRFSGVTARDLKRGSVKSLKDVQNDLLGFINANTILIGHGLENDLRALKVIYLDKISQKSPFFATLSTSSPIQRTLEHPEWKLTGDFSKFKTNGDSKEAL